MSNGSEDVAVRAYDDSFEMVVIKEGAVFTGRINQSGRVVWSLREPHATHADALHESGVHFGKASRWIRSGQQQEPASGDIVE